MTFVPALILAAVCAVLNLGHCWLQSLYQGLHGFNLIKEQLLIRPAAAVDIYCGENRQTRGQSSSGVCTLELKWKNPRLGWYGVCSQAGIQPVFTRRHYKISLKCRLLEGKVWAYEEKFLR